VGDAPLTGTPRLGSRLGSTARLISCPSPERAPLAPSRAPARAGLFLRAPQMPSRPRIDSLAAALAATEATADIWDDDCLGECVHEHVGFVSASLTARDDGADAVLAHVRQRHRRAGLFALGHFTNCPSIFAEMVALSPISRVRGCGCHVFLDGSAAGGSGTISTSLSGTRRRRPIRSMSYADSSTGLKNATPQTNGGCIHCGAVVHRHIDVGG
jgi:hypothetical protein